MLYMSSLLQVEDVRKSDSKEDDRKHANMKDKKDQEWEKGKERGNCSVRYLRKTAGVTELEDSALTGSVM